MSGYQPQEYDPRYQQPATPQQWQAQDYGQQSPAPYHGQPYYPQAGGWQQYPPQPLVNVQTNVYGPSGAVTVAGMSPGWKIFHALMIVGTCGLWLPVYWMHNSSAKRRSVTTFR